MPGWAMSLPRMLEPLQSEFGIVEVRNPSFLEAGRQTGFVWTPLPGVVCLAMSRDYLHSAIQNPHVVGIIVPSAMAHGVSVGDKALVACDQADELYHYLHMSQSAEAIREIPEIDGTAVVDPSAILNGQVRIGARARIGPRVVISGPVQIGDGTRIEAGAIVGCDGLYAKVVQGVRRHMPHFGGVEIGAKALIHAGATIVRSAILGEATRVGGGSHVGVGAIIGHDVQIGEDATISSNAVVAGRARIGARTWIGASATISNMVYVGEGATIRLGAVVIQDVPAGGDVSGNFALAHGKNMKRFLGAHRNEP